MSFPPEGQLNHFAVANASRPAIPFTVEFRNRDPLFTDVNYPIQKIWLNETINAFWFLKNFYYLSNGYFAANWIKIAQSNVVTESLRDQGGVNDVFPDATNEINVIGDGVYIKTLGDPGTNTLTILPAGGLTTLYTENTGTATPSMGNLNVFGINGIDTTGSGNTITISGIGRAFNYTNVVGPITYLVLDTDYYISCDPALGAITLQFPDAPTFKQLWVIKDRTGNASANNISITTVGGAVTIDGLTTYVMNSNYQAINLLANAVPSYEVY